MGIIYMFGGSHESDFHCQGASETGNVSHPSAHGTPMDLRNGHSRGWVPAECLEQKMRRKLSSHFAQVLLYIYNKQVTWRVGAKQVRHGYPLSSMKMHQANAAYGEKDK